MTPHRANQRGTYKIDRVFDFGLGRINLASGTSDPETFRAIDAMLTTFLHTGRHDLLREIKDGRLRPLEAFAWFRQNRLDQIPVGAMLRPLRASWATWSAELTCSAAHRKDLRSTLAALALDEDDASTLADVPRLFNSLKARKAGHHTTIRRVKMHLQAFLRDQVGKENAAYRDLKASPIGKVEPTRKATPRSVADVRALCGALSSDAAAMVWSLCATGMGPREYRGPWQLEGDGIRIEGTKRKGRNRLIPAWTGVTRPTMNLRKLARLVSAAAPGVVLYDCRATFSRWMEEAGIIKSHRAAYMGHGAKTMTEHYEFGELPGQLRADAKKLRKFVGEAPSSLRLLAAKGA